MARSSSAGLIHKDVETHSVGTIQTRTQVEEALADSEPFGSASYILGQVQRHYERRLEMISEQVAPDRASAATALLSALRTATPEHRTRVIGDPILRSTIDAAICHLRLEGPPFAQDELDATFSIAAKNLTESKVVPPLAERAERHLCLRETHGRSWIWCDERASEDPLGETFRNRFAKYHKGLGLLTPDPTSERMLSAGTELLCDLLPRLSRSAIDHLDLIVVVEPASTKFTSLTDPRIPGTIFLSPSVLGNPWQAAEFLLHEAMHVKFVDLEHTHSLLASDFKSSESPTIRPLWNRPYPGNTNEWPINRALTVMHVYVCLALFFRVVAQDSPRLEGRYGALGDLDPVKQERRALDRAYYLGEQLERHGTRTQLGLAGKYFVRWLKQILDVLDPSPPLPNSDAHLLLDLYEREAGELNKLTQRLAARRNVAAGASQPVWARTVGEMTRNEMESAQRIIRMFEAQSLCTSSSWEKSGVPTITQDDGTPFDEATQIFLSVRTSILGALRSVPREAYLKRDSLDGAKTPAGLVREMVEKSGQRLNPLFDALST